MHLSSRITIFWAEYPALSLAAARSLRTCHAPSAPRMAYRVRHRAARVRHDVRDVMRDAVRGKSLPGCSFWASGARPIRISGRAAALMLRKAAADLRALGLKPAPLLRTTQARTLLVFPMPRMDRPQLCPPVMMKLSPTPSSARPSSRIVAEIAGALTKRSDAR